MRRTLGIFLLLVGGVALLSLAWTRERAGVSVGVVSAVGVGLWVRGIREGVGRGLAWVDGVRPGYVAGVLFLVALAGCLHIALYQRERLGAEAHDEYSYRLGALMLSHGRLWEAGPGAADSFESFHVMTRPVYGSVYPPGTALLHVPGVWLGVPGWVTAVVLTALAVVATSWMLRGVAGNAMGAAGGLMLMAAPEVRTFAVPVMSHVPALLLGMAALAVANAWRERPGVWRAAGVGVAMGLLGIVRPQDAGWVVLGVLWVVAGAKVDWRRKLRDGAAAVGAALPVVALMLVHNYGLTGSALRSAYWVDTQRLQPEIGFAGSGGKGAVSGGSVVPQMVVFGREFRDASEKAQEGKVKIRVGLVLRCVLAAPVLAVVLPIGMFGLLRSRSGQGVLIAGWGFMVVYGSFAFFIENYTVLIAGCVVAAVVATPQGMAALTVRGWSVWEVERAGRVGVALAAVVVTLAAPMFRIAEMPVEQLVLADRVAAELPVKPALLLFKYEPGVNVHQEPVYNVEGGELFSAQVLRAHDLGAELNGKLFVEVAGKGPWRFVYRFDRGTRELVGLGYADELAVVGRK